MRWSVSGRLAATETARVEVAAAGAGAGATVGFAVVVVDQLVEVGVSEAVLDAERAAVPLEVPDQVVARLSTAMALP